MSYAVLDVESTIFQKGHPFSARNRLCLVGIRCNGHNNICDVEYSESPYGELLHEIGSLLHSVDVVVGFNLKFDLNWLARYGITLLPHQRVFDCQLAEFLLTNQSTRFPSLDGCLAKYNLGAKLDIVEREYWSLGIDTPQIPLETLVPYLEEDLRLTDALYLRYLQLLEQVGSTNLPNLVRLHNQDLRVLQEMEYNGIRLDWSRMAAAAARTEEELDEINRQIIEYTPQAARNLFNTGSNDHVSLLLYGGVLETRIGTPYSHTYVGGKRAGTTEIRNKWEDVRVEFPRLVDPLPKTELAKEGFWSTGADVLQELAGPKKLINLLLQQAERSKLLTTYYHGLPKVAAEMDWQDGVLHSQLNQCTVVTGRLSSSRPNQQNMPESMNEFIQSRFT